MSDSSSAKVLSNLMWRFFERCGAQGVTFVVSIVLARLIDPAAYGLIAMVMVFTTILQVFVDSGFGNALIQKKNADDLDFSSVFYCNVAVSFALYLIMFLLAPFIAGFYDMPELTPVVRVMSLSIIISGVKNIQQAYVSRNMLFKKFFWATLGGTIGAGIVGVTMAYMGYGVWALVAQYLFNMTVDTIILWLTVRWRPKRMFSLVKLKDLFAYGWKLLVSGLLDTISNQFTGLIIGKLYTPADLAFFNRGERFPNLIVTNINASIDSVLLPVLSHEQDSKERIRSMTSRAIKTSTYFMMPLMMGLAVCAVPIVRLLLTEKWLECVFFLRVFCFDYAFWPVHTANLNAIKAMGRSDLFLTLEIVKKGLSAVIFVIAMFISIKVLAYSILIIGVMSQVINAWPNKKLLEYSYIDQLRDMLPQILLSCIMGGIVYCVSFLGMSDFITLLIQIPLGIVLYISGSKLFHIDSFEYTIVLINSFLKKSVKDGK